MRIGFVSMPIVGHLNPIRERSGDLFDAAFRQKLAETGVESLVSDLPDKFVAKNICPGAGIEGDPWN
jgi:hypothetical protein